MERLAEFAVCGAFCNTLLPSGYILASIQRLGDADCVGRNLVKQGFPLRVVRAFEAMHPATSKMVSCTSVARQYTMCQFKREEFMTLVGLLFRTLRTG